jgi:hypothetical protein
LLKRGKKKRSNVGDSGWLYGGRPFGLEGMDAIAMRVVVRGKAVWATTVRTGIP